MTDTQAEIDTVVLTEDYVKELPCTKTSEREATNQDVERSHVRSDVAQPDDAEYAWLT